MSTVLVWLRNDLRLHDQPVLQAAGQLGAQHLLPVVCLPDVQASTPWGFARIGPHRRAWLANTLQNLLQHLQSLGYQLWILNLPAAIALPALARAVGATTLVCEDIAAPEEQAEVAALRAAGLQVHTVWHSSLLHPDQLPWPVAQLPAVFTPFRQAIERAGLQPAAPLPAPVSGTRAAPQLPAHAQRAGEAGLLQQMVALAGHRGALAAPGHGPAAAV
ncbi:UNVERIFIED_ORG: deoxyribodipyrimidine photolyase [Comamonas terrigena]